MTRERGWIAAVLACGEGAALSHGSAAALWGIGKERPGRIDVSVRSRGRRRRPGIRVRCRPSLSPADIVQRDGIPVTTPARTLLDRATEIGPLALERAVNDADKLDLIDPEALREKIEAYRGEPGVRRLRALLDRHTFRLSDSDLEIYFRPIAEAAGLPPPLSKQRVNGFDVDFLWPELGIVVETDGLPHRTPAQQARDRVRDQAHLAAGLVPARFTHRQVRYEHPHVREVLAAIAARRRYAD